MMNDDLDGFEMKPITSGLGFQKKQTTLKTSMKQTGVANKQLRNDIPSMRPDGLLEVPKARGSEEILNEIKTALRPFAETKAAQSSNAGVQMTSTLPRKSMSAMDAYGEPTTENGPTAPAVDPLAGIDFKIPLKDLDGKRSTQRGASDSLIQEWVPVSFSIAAAFLDAVIVLAFSMIFLVGLVSATNVDVISVMLSAKTDIPAQMSLVVLYLAMSQMYLIVSRSFAGSSIGEWTFDMQVGESTQIPKATYPLRIFMRSLYTLLTGVIVLPFLSVLFRKDFAGFLSGARLYRKNI